MIMNNEYLFFFLLIIARAADVRPKRQLEDNEDVDPLSTDELCLDRPADEYFRTTTDGDCRDVVRYTKFYPFRKTQQFVVFLEKKI